MGKNTRLRLVLYFLCALQQNRAQTRLLYLLINGIIKCAFLQYCSLSCVVISYSNWTEWSIIQGALAQREADLKLRA